MKRFTLLVVVVLSFAIGVGAVIIGCKDTATQTKSQEQVVKTVPYAPSGDSTVILSGPVDMSTARYVKLSDIPEGEWKVWQINKMIDNGQIKTTSQAIVGDGNGPPLWTACWGCGGNQAICVTGIPSGCDASVEGGCFNSGKSKACGSRRQICCDN
jgi:hypothetical protein